jgi:DNA-binding beta-propeller fold protein YncE
LEFLSLAFSSRTNRSNKKLVYRRLLTALALALVCTASIPRDNARTPIGAARFTGSTLPLFPGSLVPITLDGMQPPYDVAVVGPGSIEHDAFAIPSHTTASASTLVASGAAAVAMRTFKIAPPPSFDRSFIAVASYDDGIVVHNESAPFAAQGALAIGGAPSGVAIDSNGRIAASDTSGDTLTIASPPWNVDHFSGVPLGDELAFDPTSDAVFVTNRDVNGAGALTRVLPNGAVSHVTLGATAEGIAIDAKRRRVYVANVNDGTVSAVDADSMREIARFFVVARAFSLALSSDGSNLYVVSNQSAGSIFSAPGSVVAVDVRGSAHRIVARSANLSFPLGIALDERAHRLFVTDENDDDVAVLDQKTLHARHVPLKTCDTPWSPALDTASGRLYVPCARSDAVDVFDTSTLREIRGAPFHTGGYPLAVAVWHPKAPALR